MNFNALLKELKKLEFREKRFDSPDYLELVFTVSQLPELSPLLEGHFGRPFKAAGEKLRGGSWEFLEKYGGVRQDQTLYFVEEKGAVFYAMLWPWSDRANVTAKIAEYRRKPK